MTAAARRRQRGAALFVVLLFAAFLSGLAAAAMRSSLSGVRAAAVFADAVRADELGRGAADILAFHLAGSDAGAPRGGRIATHLPGAEVLIDYVSESARVDANLGPVPLIALLLAAAGAERGEVDAVVGRIVRFRAEKANEAAQQKAIANPEGLAAITAQLKALGPNTQQTAPPPAIRDVAEIAGAWGLPDDLAGRVLPVLTVSNGTAKVDPVLADRLLVTALLGADERVDDYLARRQQGFVNKDSALELLPVPARAFVDFKDSPAVRAVVRVTIERRFERRYEMIMAPKAASDAAPTRDAIPVVVSWRKLL